MPRKNRKLRRVLAIEHLEDRTLMDASLFSLLTPPAQPISLPASTNHGYLYDTAANAAGAFLAGGYQDGTVECRGPDGTLRWTTNTGIGRAYYIEVDPDGNTVYVSAGAGATSRLIALSAENGSVRWSAATGTFANLVTARNGTVAVDVDSTGILRFSADTGARVGGIVGGAEAFWNGQIGDGRILYRAGGSIFVQNTSGSAQKIMDFPAMPGPPAIAADGSLAAFGASSGEVRVLRTNDYWSTLMTFNTGSAVQALAFSEDGKFLAVGTADGTIVEQRVADAGQSSPVITKTGSPIYNLVIAGPAVLAQNGTMGASWTVVRSTAAVDAVMTQSGEQATPVLPQISVVPATPAIGPDMCRGGYPSPQGIARPFDTTGDLAYQGNGSARPAVARDTIAGYAAIHQSTYINDGMYGNGTSWIANSPGSWFKIDLGADFLIDRVMFGRDRVAGFDDRDPGQFTIQVAPTDDVYANGNESNDAAEYSTVFDSRNVAFDGSILQNQTLEARFPPVQARFVKIVVANAGAAIDEVQVFAAAPSNQPPVPGNDSHTFLEDTPLTIAADTLLSNDSPGPANESGQTVTFVSRNPVDSTSAAKGTVAYDPLRGEVRYSPPPNFNGLDTFTYHVVDDGSPQQTAIGTVSVTVTSVNDAPQGADKNVPTPEDTPYVFSATDFGFSDPNDDPADKLLAVKITTLPITGSLTINDVAVVAGQVVEADDISGGKLAFTPEANASGTNYASFAFQVIDDGGTANGGVDRDVRPKTMTIDVVPVNDAPRINVPTEPTSTQPDAPTLPAYGLLVVSATPAMGPAMCRGDYVAPQCIALPFDTTGDLAYQGNGYARPAVANGSLAGYPSIHQPEYVNDGMYGNGTSWIGAGAGGTVKLDMGREVEIDRVMFGRDRAVGFDDRDPGQFTIQVATSDDVYANGNESNDAVEYSTVFDSRNVAFDGNIWQNQTLEARFPPVRARFIKLTVANLGAGIDEVQVFGPALGDDAAESEVQSLQTRTQSTLEDQPLVFSAANGNAISIADVDALDQPEHLTLGVTHGTLTLAATNGLTFLAGGDGTSSLSMTATLAALNAALDGLTYTPARDYNGPDALTIAANDLGNNGTGGPLTATSTVGLIISPVNDPPTLDSIPNLAILEDSDYLDVYLTGISAGSGESQPLAISVTSSNPSLISGAAVRYDGAGDTATLTVRPEPDKFGTAELIVAIQEDEAGGDGEANTVTRTWSLVVEPVNDPPVVAEPPTAVTLYQGAAPRVLDLDRVFIDLEVDANADRLAFTINNSNSSLLATILAGAKLTLSPIAGQSGTADVTVTATDLAGATAGCRFQVTVLPSNAAPTLDAIADPPPIPEVPVPLTIPLTDISAGPNETQTLTVTAISSNPLLTPELIVDYTSPNSTGTLRLTPNAYVSGTATISVTVMNDGGTVNSATDGITRSFTVATSDVVELADVRRRIAEIESQRETHIVIPSLTVIAYQDYRSYLAVAYASMPDGLAVQFGTQTVPLPPGTSLVRIPLESFTHASRIVYTVQLVWAETRELVYDNLGGFGVASGGHTYDYGYSDETRASFPSLDLLSHPEFLPFSAEQKTLLTQLRQREAELSVSRADRAIARIERTIGDQAAFTSLLATPADRDDIQANVDYISQKTQELSSRRQVLSAVDAEINALDSAAISSASKDKLPALRASLAPIRDRLSAEENELLPRAFKTHADIERLQATLESPAGSVELRTDLVDASVQALTVERGSVLEKRFEVIAADGEVVVQSLRGNTNALSLDQGQAGDEPAVIGKGRAMALDFARVKSRVTAVRFDAGSMEAGDQLNVKFLRGNETVATQTVPAGSRVSYENTDGISGILIENARTNLSPEAQAFYDYRRTYVSGYWYSWQDPGPEFHFFVSIRPDLYNRRGEIIAEANRGVVMHPITLTRLFITSNIAVEQTGVAPLSGATNADYAKEVAPQITGVWFPDNYPARPINGLDLHAYNRISLIQYGGAPTIDRIGYLGTNDTFYTLPSDVYTILGDGSWVIHPIGQDLRIGLVASGGRGYASDLRVGENYDFDYLVKRGSSLAAVLPDPGFKIEIGDTQLYTVNQGGSAGWSAGACLEYSRATPVAIGTLVAKARFTNYGAQGGSFKVTVYSGYEGVPGWDVPRATYTYSLGPSQSRRLTTPVDMNVDSQGRGFVRFVVETLDGHFLTEGGRTAPSPRPVDERYIAADGTLQWRSIPYNSTETERILRTSVLALASALDSGDSGRIELEKRRLDAATALHDNTLQREREQNAATLPRDSLDIIRDSQAEASTELPAENLAAQIKRLHEAAASLDESIAAVYLVACSNCYPTRSGVRLTFSWSADDWINIPADQRERELLELVSANSQIFVETAKRHPGVSPQLIAAILWDELVGSKKDGGDGYDWWDYRIDKKDIPYFWKTGSIGPFQITIATATDVITNGFCRELAGCSSLAGNPDSLRARLQDLHFAAEVAAGRLEQTIVHWRNLGGADLSNRDDILGTLYSIGLSGKRGVNDTPEAIDRGRAIAAKAQELAEYLNSFQLSQLWYDRDLPIPGVSGNPAFPRVNDHSAAGKMFLGLLQATDSAKDYRAFEVLADAVNSVTGIDRAKVLAAFGLDQRCSESSPGGPLSALERATRLHSLFVTGQYGHIFRPWLTATGESPFAPGVLAVRTDKWDYTGSDGSIRVRFDFVTESGTYDRGNMYLLTYQGQQVSDQPLVPDFRNQLFVDVPISMITDAFRSAYGRDLGSGEFHLKLALWPYPGDGAGLQGQNRTVDSFAIRMLDSFGSFAEWQEDIGVITQDPNDPVDPGDFGDGRVNHGGYDIHNQLDTAISAYIGGTVESISGRVTDSKGWGLTVVLRDERGNRHRYAHLNSVDPGILDAYNSGQSVEITTGQVFARMGRSGTVSGPTGIHLHYEVKSPTGELLDPAALEIP